MGSQFDCPLSPAGSRPEHARAGEVNVLRSCKGLSRTQESGIQGIALSTRYGAYRCETVGASFPSVWAWLSGRAEP